MAEADPRARAPAGWAPEGAWAGILADGRIGAPDGPAGLVAAGLESVTFATIQAAPGAAAALDRRIAAAFGTGLPRPRRMSRGDDLDIVWSGPDSWLAGSGLGDVPSRLAEAAGPDGSVVAAPGSRALLWLTGPRIRDTLAKGCPIDLHNAAFPAGAAAVTAIAHMGVQIWRPNAEGFGLAVSRSYAGSLWSWLKASGAEFGIDVRVP